MAPRKNELGQSGHSARRLLVVLLVGTAVALAGSALAQTQTLARLSHDTTEVVHTPIASTTISPAPPAIPRSPRADVLRDSSTSRAAARAFFANSDLPRARTLGARALRRNAKDAEALFVTMEVAAMQDDAPVMVDAAIRLCELGENSPGDLRVRLAAVRIAEIAANTPEFRSAIPRVRAVLADSQQPWPALHAALLRAAMDGTPSLDPYAVARAAGILTDWRIVGPFRPSSLSDIDDPVPHGDDLSRGSYGSHAVENFQYPDGKIALPEYLARHGQYWGAAHFASLADATWQVQVETTGSPQVYVDGRLVLRVDNASGRRSAQFEASPGPHRVLVKFSGAATPMRVAITPVSADLRQPPPQQNTSLQELAYLLAVEHYVSGDFDVAVKQLNAVPATRNSAALQFLLAQASAHNPAASTTSLDAWSRVEHLAPTAISAQSALAKEAMAERNSPTAFQLASDALSVRPFAVQALEVATATWPKALASSGAPSFSEGDLWSRRITVHPSCKTLREAVEFYVSEGHGADAASAQQKLDGCAPESLDYALSLSREGSHARAAAALQQLIEAAPLNRAARLMLIRELQLAGRDEAAQHAALAWVHVAPNAEKYHRLAAAALDPTDETEMSQPFYQPYRRDAFAILHDTADRQFSGNSVLLLDDHVAVSRQDGSVSLYVHEIKRVLAAEAGARGISVRVPVGAQVLALRVIRPDGSTQPIDRGSAETPLLLAGDAVDEEYVLHYAGDGGIPEHSEVFQFVFGSFNEQVLHARFVVLTPAEQADRGAVITTGGAPEMIATVRGNMLQRVWEEDRPNDAAKGSAQIGKGLPIVRVVEQDNGWSMPSSAEHQRRIETIHPGPRPEDS